MVSEIKKVVNVSMTPMAQYCTDKSFLIILIEVFLYFSFYLNRKFIAVIPLISDLDDCCLVVVVILLLLLACC